MSTNIVLTNNNYNDYLGSDFNAKVESTVFESHTGDTTVHHTLTELDGLYVDIDGDTMTGNLTLNTANLDLDNTTFANQKGVIMKDGVPFIHNFNYGDNATVTTEGKNIFIGEGAGNFTMGSTATATNQSSYNVGIGYSVLSGTTKSYFNTAIGTYALQNNLEGYQNTAIGYNALKNNTTNNNVSIGANSSQLNTSGTGNVTVGVNAAIDNTTGNYNTVVGFLALENNDGGVGNTAIGKYAGRYFAASDPLTSPDYCIFLGTATLASEENVQYENVIGANAIGAGRNTTTIGNTSQTLCKINGAVQVGQSSATPTAALVGAIRYRTSGNNSYCEMVMQTAASTYAWVEIKKNTW